MENTYDFCIQNPKWHKFLFFVFLFFGLLGVIIVTTLWLVFKIKMVILIGFLIISVFFLIISSLGLYIYYKEKFYLENQTFTYIKPFKKSQSALVSQILRVEVSHNGILVKIEFIGKSGEKLISFLDDGTAFKNNYLLDALNYYKIPFINNSFFNI